MHNRARWLGLMLSAAMLAGCSSSSTGWFGGKKDDVDPNIFPANSKKEILVLLSTSLDDPTNIRSAMVSDPALRAVGPDQRYTVCLRFDARDYTRQYTGVKEHIAYFFGGRLNQLVDAAPGQCAGAQYKPFPELEKLCLGAKCN